MNNAHTHTHTHRPCNDHESINEAEVITDFDGEVSNGFDDDFDTGFVPNRVDHVPHVAMQGGVDDDDWTGDGLTVENLPEDDPFDESAQGHQHAQLVKGLLLRFIDEHQRVTAADICGPKHWNRFTENEKYAAEYLIAEMIEELQLPLQADSTQSYPAPRRYSFI